jgi:arylsulfatase A-like enzyme
MDSLDGRLLDPTSPYWNKVSLPHMRGLAAKGVNFARTYTASPQCVPSRTSMITSRYVHETSTYNNGIGIAASTATGKLDSHCVSDWGEAQCAAFQKLQGINATFLDHLHRQANMSLNLFGRFDIGAGILDECNTCSGDGFHGGPDLTILTRAANILRPTKPSPYSMVDDDTPNPYGDDETHTELALEWLRTHEPAAPGSGQPPWLLWMGILAPHPPYDTNATWLAQVNESAVDVPPLPDRATMHPYDTYMSISKNAIQEDNATHILAVRRSYWAAAAEADALLGAVLDVANRTGHLDNTLVIFTADHGEMAMEMREVWKNNLREPSTRVPLVMASFAGASGNGGGVPQDVLVTNLTSHLDIFPTLANLSGTRTPDWVRGFSLTPFMTAAGGAPAGGPVFPRTYVATEYHSNMGNTGTFGIVAPKPASMVAKKEEVEEEEVVGGAAGGAAPPALSSSSSSAAAAAAPPSYVKLILFGGRGTFPWFSNYTAQLFDISADPFELNNLAPAYPDVVASLEAQLLAEFRVASIDQLDAAAKALDLSLYKSQFQDVYNTTELYKQFQQAYSGFNETDAEQIGKWCGAVPGA